MSDMGSNDCLIDIHKEAWSLVHVRAWRSNGKVWVRLDNHNRKVTSVPM